MGAKPRGSLLTAAALLDSLRQFPSIEGRWSARRIEEKHVLQHRNALGGISEPCLRLRVKQARVLRHHQPAMDSGSRAGKIRRRDIESRGKPEEALMPMPDFPAVLVYPNQSAQEDESDINRTLANWNAIAREKSDGEEGFLIVKASVWPY